MGFDIADMGRGAVGYIREMGHGLQGLKSNAMSDPCVEGGQV